MHVEIVKNLIDACFTAKRITELTPPLPTGMVPRHNNVIDKIHELSQTKAHVYISDISRQLNTTAPSITKLVGQLEGMGYLVKIFDQEDRRYVSIKLTDKGESHYYAFIETYHKELAELMEDMNGDDCLSAVDTINRLYSKMKAYTDEAKEIGG